MTQTAPSAQIEMFLNRSISTRSLSACDGILLFELMQSELAIVFESSALHWEGSPSPSPNSGDLIGRKHVPKQIKHVGIPMLVILDFMIGLPPSG